MKRGLLFSYSFFGFFLLLFFLASPKIFAENKGNCAVVSPTSFLVGTVVTFAPDNLPAFANPNDYNKAYRTVMPKTGSPQVAGFTAWEDFVWAEYEKKGNSGGDWKIMAGYPPTASGVTIDGISYPNVNRTLIFVDYCHKVKLDKGFNYQNKLDLIVCGELQVGSLVITIPVPEMIVSNVVSNNEICLGGLYLTGSVNFSEVDVTGIGFVIAPYPLLDEGLEVDIYDYLYGNSSGDLPVSSYPIVISNVNNIYFDPETADPLNYIPGGSQPFEYNLCLENYSGGQYQIIAYGVNESGTGYSEVFIFPPQDTEGKGIQSNFNKLDGEEDPGTTSTFNNFTLTLCDENSLFKVDHLIVGNNTTLNINGTFYVETISGSNTSSAAGSQGFCVYGTGVILTPTGGIPAFCNVSGWNNGYFFNEDGECVAYTNADGEVEYPEGYTPGADNNPCGFSDGTLPIDLLSITSSVKPDRIELKWTTGTEINNDYFTLERSRDLYGWEVLGFVPGAGNSSVPLSYSFSDLRPMDGLAYYRLKQTDFDGKFEYFGPIAAHYDLGMEGLDFKVLKQYTNWVIAVPNDGIYQVEVYNLQGHRLANEKIENNLVIPAPQGAVVIRVTDGFARSASRVVM